MSYHHHTGGGGGAGAGGRGGGRGAGGSSRNRSSPIPPPPAAAAAAGPSSDNNNFMFRFGTNPTNPTSISSTTPTANNNATTTASQYQYQYPYPPYHRTAAAAAPGIVSGGSGAATGHHHHADTPYSSHQYNHSHYHQQQYQPTAYAHASGSSESHSPFLNQLLRFSPHSSSATATAGAAATGAAGATGGGSAFRFSPKNTTSSSNVTVGCTGGVGAGAGSSSQYQFHFGSSTLSNSKATTTTSNNNNTAAAATAAAQPACTPVPPSTQQQQQQQQQAENNANANATTTDNNNNNNNVEVDEEILVVDGIPINKLRKLARTSSFFASMLYAKTNSSQDALLLAKARLKENDAAGCLALLEEAGLILLDYMMAQQQQQQQQQQSSSSVDIYWNAMLVACKALVETEQWTVLLPLLEEACRNPLMMVQQPHGGHHGGETPMSSASSSYNAAAVLQDDDTLGWQALAQSIHHDNSSSNNNNNDDDNVLHPLSMICYYRGLAYYHTGDSIRAAVYWKRSVYIDRHCQMSWQCLLSYQLIAPHTAYQFLESLEWLDTEQWLKTLYIAAIEVHPQRSSSITFDDNNEKDASFIDAATAADEAAAPAHTPLQVSFHESTTTATANQHNKMSSLKTPNITNTNNQEDGDDDETAINTNNNNIIQEYVDDAFDKLLSVHKLGNAPHVLALAARRAYRRYQWKQALHFCQQLDQLGALTSPAAYCYVSVLTLLGHKRSLFRLAHAWVDAHPKSAQSWFAVGCYYYACERYHVAQRHFCRATRLDPNSTESWIAFGCSFAAVDESDQALASFRAAQRLSPGQHAALLYMGMEYVRTNHLVLAQCFLQAAQQIGVDDPLVSHERGVLELLQGEYDNAIQYFLHALQSLLGLPATTDSSSSTSSSVVQETLELLQDAFWEPTVYNLGHAYRKSRQYTQAEQCFQKCVSLLPQKSSTWSALAFTKHLRQDYDGAIEGYHQALSCKPDDPFSSEMLSRALREALDEGLHFDDDKYGARKKASRTTVPAVAGAVGAIGTSTPTAAGTTVPQPAWTFNSTATNESSIMSEDMDSDVDMG